ncbi:MAG: RHS repeat-associated core domain-containing protein [Rhodoferax sp.]|nr:RHS repeat-associated core domain-containing protein [Rhodoferax sp.]MDP3650856.1 RHS repeat-associated core domain-containing protein [Rhodoferax sp.]
MSLLAALNASATESNLDESDEIQFNSAAAADLKEQASALSTPVAIYEFVRNNYDFSLYHGAHSGSVNTYLGGRGNDVDLAATLIAMLRSQGIPARYSVATVRVPSPQVMNWLAVENVDLAKDLLRSQGIQAVVLSPDKSTIAFEHVWVEALVPYGNYRGTGKQTANCVAQSSTCNWIPLDPSFKQRVSRNSGLDPYSSLSFDYTAYYNALKKSDAASLAMRDKNPLEIYQENVLNWLRENAPGKTLNDIPDFQGIIPEQAGLLPASLPYAIAGAVRHYSSVGEHDDVAKASPAIESKLWNKYVSLSIEFASQDANGYHYEGKSIYGIDRSNFSPTLVDLATKRLTVSTRTDDSIQYYLSIKLDGYENWGTLKPFPYGLGYPFKLTVAIDGPPSVTDATDSVISAPYYGVVGGYYLVAVGGETSNWSQVHRAAQGLLTANQQNKIVFKPGEVGCDATTHMGCTPYIDVNGGGWDPTDTPLLENIEAMDALTGGILNVAATQYYAKLRESLSTVDAINKIKTSITGFLGVVSSTHEAEYIDGTAFSILPGGLLIDMKGLTVLGSLRIDQPAAYSNKQFELIGHIASSLEHETWQELTGYDAISTVRGIQMALASGAALVNLGQDTWASASSAFNLTTGNPPQGFTAVTPQNAQYANLLKNVNDSIFQPDSQKWVGYTIPSQQTVSVSPNYKFSVDIKKTYAISGAVTSGNVDTAGMLTSATYEISNNTGTTAGGGYVPAGGVALTQSSPIVSAVLPSFDNATLTDKNTIAVANNDLIKTASTADPVSTITGNNYHDETDFVIKGRAGLNYAFTRTYNSAPSSSQADTSGLGFGWTHSYAMHLKSNDYGSCPNCTSAQSPEISNNKTSSITYTDERGGDHNYLVNESTYAVTSPQGEFDALALDTPAVGQHTLTFGNGTRYIFETVSGSLKTTPGIDARLKQIVDLWGNQLNFSYNGNSRLSTVTDNLAIAGRTGLVFSYDTNGYIQKISDWSGRNWGYTVTNHELVAYTNALVQSVTYTYTGKHNLYQVKKPLRGVQTAFTYYQNGRTFNYQNARGEKETLDYDLYRKTTRVTDPRGGIREYEYDTSGRLNKLTEPDGAILQFANNPDGLRNSKIDGLGYKTQYAYRGDKSFNTISDTSGNVTREQDALDNTIDTSYGPYGQIASVKDKNGSLTTTTYHASTDSLCRLNGKPDTVTLGTLSDGDGSTYSNLKLASYCWNSDGTLKQQTDYLDRADTSKTRVTTYNYDAAHLNVLSVTQLGWDSATVTRSFTYDVLGRKKTDTLLARRNSPTDSNTTDLSALYDYDSIDRVIQVTDAVGNKLGTTFDDNGQVFQIVAHYVGGSDRTLSTRTYDSADRLQTETDVLNNVTTYGYDAAGNVAWITDAEKHTTRFEYDAMNRRTAVVDANGNRSTTRYDLAGHLVAATNGNNETTKFSYDRLGRLLTQTDPLGYTTSFRYDANGNRICVVDANAQAGLKAMNTDGCTSSTGYDQLQRTTSSTDALNRKTVFSYDLLGNITSIKDASGKTTQMSYDGLGRLTKVMDPLNKATDYIRDAAGNIWQTSNRLGQLTQTSYDRLNRPTTILYQTDGKTETLGYDVYGNLHTLANGALSYTFEYDAKSRLLIKLDSRGRSMSFNYDKTGNVLTKTDYVGERTDFTYDAANRRIAMRNAAYLSASYQHDGAGRVLARLLSNGAQTQYSYNGNGQLTNLKTVTANGAVLNNVSYISDRVGNILSQTDATGISTYSYDPLYQLLSADYPGTANDESFTYDAVGNRNTHTLNGQTRAYEYRPNSNRLAAIHTGTLAGAIEKAFVWDDEGRLSSQTGGIAKTLGWDQKNRAKAINGVTYNYDPLNYRIGQQGGTLGNRDYYLEGEHLEAEYANGYRQAKYFRGLSTDELLAGYSYDANGNNGTPTIYHHDALMSVTGLSTHEGGTVQTANYSAFGDRTVSAVGVSNNRLTYTGREKDGDTGLYYYRARYYDPAIGRFISEDPLGFAAGDVNFYQYTANNPVNANDPSGYCPSCIGAGTSVFLGGSIRYAMSGGNWSAVFDPKAMAIDAALGAVGAGIANKVNALARLRDVPSTVASFSTKLGASASAKVEQGIYLVESNGAKYVGQSGQVTTRLGQHVSNGKFAAEATDDAVRLSIAGGKTSREVAEQRTLNLMRETNAAEDILNISNSVGKAREGLLTDISLGIADDIFVPNVGWGVSAASGGAAGSVYEFSGAAQGGFLIYPNKSNQNAMRSVYAK